MMKYLMIFCALFMGSVTGALADDNYPSKPVHVVVPFPPGVTTDIVARSVSQALSERLGQSFIVENKAGADGTIGVRDVIRSKPDGYSLLVATNGPLSAVPNLTSKPPYDVLTDLTPVSDVGRATFAVYVSEHVPVNTLPEFIEYTRANPGKLNYASGNLTGQLSFAYMTMNADLDMTHIPYAGETNAMTDLLGGRVEAIVATLGTGLPLVRDGKLKMLAVIADERNAEAPDVPVIAEVGFPDFPIQSWFGLFGPAGLPENVVTTLNQAVTDALQDPVVIEQFKSIRATVSSSTPEGAAEVLQNQLDAHGNIIRDAGIKLD